MFDNYINWRKERNVDNIHEYVFNEIDQVL